MRLQELRDEIGTLWEQAKALNDKRRTENREFSGEEEQQWQRLNAELNALEKRIKTEEEAEALEKRFGARVNPGVGRPATGPDTADRAATQQEYAAAFDTWLRWGAEGLAPEHRTLINPQRSEVAPRRRIGNATEIEVRIGRPVHSPAFEQRAQAVGTGAAGGFTVPEGFVSALEVSLLAFGGMRQAARILPTESGNDLPWPTLNDTAQTGELLAENVAAAQQDVTFGQTILKAYKYSSKEVLVSRELLEDSGVDIAAVLGAALGERIGRITNTHFTTGDNASKPQGAVTYAAAGITAAVAGAITVDELISLFHEVDPAYRNGPKVAFMFRDSTLAALRKLTKADWAGGSPIWQPGLTADAPSTILAKPYFINQDMAAIATGNKSVLFGDFSKYIIRDVASFRLRRLEERYAEKDQVSFIAFSRHDGRVLDAGTDPIKRLLQP